MNPSFRFAQFRRKYADLLLNKKGAIPPSNNALLQVHFYIKFGQKYLSLFSVKDFDTELLKKYTVKVLQIIHASSLGSAKFSSIWILDYLWKQCFFFVFFFSRYLKSGRIPSWHLQFIIGNNDCKSKSKVCFMGLIVRLQSDPHWLPAWVPAWVPARCGWFDQANVNHGWLDHSILRDQIFSPQFLFENIISDQIYQTIRWAWPRSRNIPWETVK